MTSNDQPRIIKLTRVSKTSATLTSASGALTLAELRDFIAVLGKLEVSGDTIIQAKISFAGTIKSISAKPLNQVRDAGGEQETS